MNLWVARGPAARAEASLMSPFEGAFLSMKNGAPVNGQVQDSVVGSYALTREGVELDKYHAMQLLARAGVEPPRFTQERYTGREVVSLLFRRTPFDLERTPSSFSDVFAPYVAYAPGETRTVFAGGRLERGVLDKATVGEKAVGGVFHLIAREYGPRAALGAVYALQQAALQFLLWRGFSIGTADLLPGPAARARIRELVSGVRLEADAVSARLLRGEVVPPIGSSVLAFYESLQLNALKIPEAEVLRWILEGVRPESNGLFQMVAAGSKGSVPNMIHIGGGIGQTTINGERLAELFAFGRALPYFPRYSTDPAARGFVANSYVTGMSSVEFIGQAMNGRFDLINKALSTASTGYFARKGVMNNQSTVVNYAFAAVKDRSVVMFLFGDTGLDPRELEAVALPTAELDDAALAALGAGPLVAAALAADPAGAGAAALGRALAALAADRDAFRAAALRLEGAALEAQGSFGPGFRSPVNVRRLAAGVLRRPGREAPPPPDGAGLAARLAAVEALASGLAYAYSNAARAAAGAPPSPPHAAGAARAAALVRAELAPETAAALTLAELGWLGDAVRNRYGLSLAGPGTAVGVLAAQALSEPLTQYMLDSHHRSVGGGTSKSGLVRVQEIYGARGVAAEAAPRMLLPLRAGADARAVANRLEHVTLRRFVARLAVLLEPPGALRFPGHAGDAAWLAEFAAAHPLLAPPADLTNWCYRFVLSRAELVLKAVALADVVRALRRAFEGRAFVAHTAEAVPEIVVRVWLRPALLKGAGAGAAGGAGLAEAFLDTPVRGVAGIVRAEARAVTRSAVAEGGGVRRAEVAAVETFGTNLFHAALIPEVDPLRAVSSSVGDTYRLFGVEAARAKIVSETMSFMASGAPNAAHLYIYASEMTRTGCVTSVERGGLGAREPRNVLLRMAYGAPVQVVTDAALAGTRAPVYGIAAPQLLGAAPRVGTTYSRYAVNEAFVAANSTTVEDVLDSL